MKAASFLCLAFLLALPRAFATGPAPRLSRERIVLRTTDGDLVLALFPQAAPKHAARILELVRLGAYDGTHFFKISPAAYLHLSGVAGRRLPLSAAQSAAVGGRLEAETSAIRLRYGIVAVAHDRGDRDDSGTSLVILLAPIPAMQGKFTVLGAVEKGLEVLEAIRREPRDGSRRPLRRIEVERAFVVDSPEAMASVYLRGPEQAGLGLGPEEPIRGGWALAAMGLCGGLSLILWKVRRAWPRAASIGLLALLAAFFGAFAAYAPQANLSSAVSVGLFIGAIMVFRLMGFFETRL